MKKFIVLSIVLLMLAGFAITSSAMDVTLWAGQNINVGTLTVEVVGDNLEVTYIMDPDEGWELLETHLYVGTSPPEKSAPGRFPYDAIDGVYEIDLETDFPEATTLYIAAQAEVRKQEVDPDTGELMFDPDTGEPIYQEETVWAEGDEIRPDKNWAMFFTFPVVAP